MKTRRIKIEMPELLYTELTEKQYRKLWATEEGSPARRAQLASFQWEEMRPHPECYAIVEPAPEELDALTSTPWQTEYDQTTGSHPDALPWAELETIRLDFWF